MSTFEKHRTERHFGLCPTTLQDLVMGFRETFGTRETDAVLFHTGAKAGRRACDKLKPITKNSEATVECLAELKANQNWGDIVLEKVDWGDGSGRISVTDCFEARDAAFGKPACYFTKGFFTGFFSELLGAEMTLIEDKCRAMGDDRCEYTFTKIRKQPLFQ